MASGHEGMDDAITEITQSIFEMLFGLEARPASGEGLAGPGRRTVAGCVQITGAFEGSVAVYCTNTLARQAAGILFDVAEGIGDDAQAQELVAEIANMAGGNVKALVAEPSRLSLPAVAEGTDFHASIPGSRLVSAVAFECEGEPLLISLLEREVGH